MAARISPEWMAKLKGFEGCILLAYQDPGGVWTIGWGHTPSYAGQLISQADADALLLGDLAVYEEAVEKLLVHPVSPHVFDAIVDFAYNVGVDGWTKSEARECLEAGDVPGCAVHMGKYVHDNHGVIDLGLVNRRVAEIVWMLT